MFGLMHRRVQVEVEWFIALGELGLDILPPLSATACATMRNWVQQFSEADAKAIKAIERTTNHDVKAVEYWLKQRIAASGLAELQRSAEFVHFACTSEDINNTSHALMLKAAREQVLLPALERVIGQLRTMALAHAEVPMLSRTHGQTASPTTVGKEIANVVARLEAARARIAAVPLLAKMNGAVGNYNAHLAAYPDFDWEAFSRDVVEASTYYSGGAGLSSTIYDYGIFLQMLLENGVYNGKRILSRNAVRMMTMNQIGDLSRGDDKFGLGFQVVTERGSARTPAQAGTSSWGGAFATSYWVDPKEKIVMLFYRQLQNTTKGEMVEKFRALTYQALND